MSLTNKEDAPAGTQLSAHSSKYYPRTKLLYLDNRRNRPPVMIPTLSIPGGRLILQSAAYKITRLALPVDYDRVMKFMRTTYFKSEPSLVNIGLTTAGEIPTPLVHLMREHFKEGMTIIAEAPDNCVVGVAINGGSCPWHPEKTIEFAECCCEKGPTQDLIKFYAYVTSQPKLWDRYRVLKIFECCYLGVGTEYLGRGIARRLVRESWYLARDCGYQVFRIDCTSKYTAKIAEGFHWKCVFSIPYKRYINRCGLVFKHIQQPHTEVRVFIDQPLICKDYCIANPDDCEIGSTPDDK